MTEVSSAFKLDFPEGLVEKTAVFREEVTLYTAREKLLDLLTYLKNEQQFNMLSDVTCTGGLKPLAECLALGEQCGFR